MSTPAHQKTKLKKKSEAVVKMLEAGKISNKQLVFLIISILLSTTSIFLPSAIYQEVKQDAWMVIILVVLVTAAAAFVLALLGNRFQDSTIIQYSTKILGIPLGKVVGLLYIIYFIYINAIIFREFMDMITTSYMPETPSLVVCISLFIAVAYLVRSGIEVLSRVSEITIPVILLLLVVVIMMVLPEVKISNFKPVMETGLLEITKSIYVPLAFFLEIVTMLMLVPYVNKPAQVKRTFILGVVISGLFLLLIMFAVIGVFGNLVGSMNFSTLRVIKYIKLFNLIERVEPVIMLMWVYGISIKIAVFFYCSVLALAQWLNLREYKALVLPTGVIIITLSFIMWDSSMQLKTHVKTIAPFFIVVEIAIPAFLLGVSALRGIKGVRK
ncbi:MAG: spore germination protein [Clostridiales bacterium]|nr:spore germination protein [Clostridiales bacterium]MCF8021874.1 spore germination protein [Clostridiales bacterium]